MKARLRKALAPFAALTVFTTGSAYGAGQDQQVVTVPIAGGQATVDTRTLGVTGHTADGRTVTLSAPAKEPLGTPGRVTARGGVTTWTYPDRGLGVEVSADHGRLAVNLRSSGDTALTWPVTGTDRETTAMQIPRGEGVHIPVADPFWNSPESGLTDTELKDLTMPFWGTSTASGGASYLVPTDLGTRLRFVSADKRLSAEATHEFKPARRTGAYTVLLSLTTGAPTAAAQDYRGLLGERGLLSTLEQKIRDNPDTGKLTGAFHAYLWGDGRSARAIGKLRELGISRCGSATTPTASPSTATRPRRRSTPGTSSAPTTAGTTRNRRSRPTPRWRSGPLRCGRTPACTTSTGNRSPASRAAGATSAPRRSPAPNRLSTTSKSGWTP